MASQSIFRVSREHELPKWCGVGTASIGGLDPDRATVFFCNGPQCAATPDAIRTLLASGYPPETILYYRGGIHDWMTLGLPIEAPS